MNRISIEAAVRVIDAAMALVSEEQAKVAALEAEISGPGSRNVHHLRRMNSQLQAKIDSLLELCDETSYQEIKEVDKRIHISQIREILAP